MAGIRRALLWATTSRYFITAINLLTTAILAQILTAEEYGLAVVGMSVSAIAEAFRELGGGAYLIQRKVLDSDHIRTTITVSFIITLIMAAVIILLAEPLARYSGNPELKNYVLLVCLWYLMGPFFYPILALMSRKFEFGKLAVVNVVTSVVSSVATVLLAVDGFSYMSFAWAAVASGVVGVLLSFYLWRDLSIFRPMLREWRDVLAFSAYSSVNAVLFRLWEILPYFILVRILNIKSVGILQRALSVCLFPERVIMAGVGVVALPAFSERARDGRDLKDAYFGAIEHITGLQWPALGVLALLAHPVVSVLFGAQWLDTVPLITIGCVALLFRFPIGLNYPLLVAVGAIRFVPAFIVFQATVSIGVLTFAAQFGLRAAVLSMLFTVPFNVLFSMLLVRRHVHFAWSELWLAMRRSSAVALLSIVGPLLVAIAYGWNADMSFTGAIIAIFLAACGWLGGIWLTGHPLFEELLRARTLALSRFQIN